MATRKKITTGTKKKNIKEKNTVPTKHVYCKYTTFCISKRYMADKPVVMMLLAVIAKFTINSNICFFSQIRAHGSLLSSKFSKPAVVKTCPGFWHHQLASVYISEQSCPPCTCKVPPWTIVPHRALDDVIIHSDPCIDITCFSHATVQPKICFQTFEAVVSLVKLIKSNILNFNVHLSFHTCDFFLLRSCCGLVDRTTDSWGPRFELKLLAAAVVPSLPSPSERTSLWA